jgi:hypothetical protein
MTGLDALGSQTDRPQTEHSRQHNQKSDTRPFAANLEKSPSVEQPSLEGRRGKTVFRLRLQSHVANPARTFDFNQTEQKWLCQEKGAKQVRSVRRERRLLSAHHPHPILRCVVRHVKSRHDRLGRAERRLADRALRRSIGRWAVSQPRRRVRAAARSWNGCASKSRRSQLHIVRLPLRSRALLRHAAQCCAALSSHETPVRSCGQGREREIDERGREHAHAHAHA